MTLILRSAHRILGALQTLLNLAWISTGALSLAFMLLAIYVTGSGGTAFLWLRGRTGQDSWPLATSAALFAVFEISAASALAVKAVRVVLNFILLSDAYSGEGTVISLRQTGARMNLRPVMALRLQVDSREGTVVATTRKLIDLGNIPRSGDRVRLRISAIDPTCVSYQGRG